MKKKHILTAAGVVLLCYVIFLAIVYHYAVPPEAPHIDSKLTIAIINQIISGIVNNDINQKDKKCLKQYSHLQYPIYIKIKNKHLIVNNAFLSQNVTQIKKWIADNFAHTEQNDKQKSFNIDIFLSFIGKRKAAFFKNSFLWNITMQPGLDGLWLQNGRNFKILLPEQMLNPSLAGGKVFSFLPVKLGLSYRRSMNMLIRKKSFSGIKSNANKSTIYYFRNRSFYCGIKMKHKKVIITITPLYRGKPLVNRGNKKIKKHDVLNSAKLAGNWFVNQLREDRLFNYRINPFSGKVYMGNYSLPRHAGSVLIMYRIYKLIRNKVYLTNADNALGFLLSKIQTNKNIVYISDNPYFAKLGTTVLTILALFERKTATLQDNYDSLIIKLLNYIKFMQKKDGSFCHYFSRNSGRDTKTVSQNFSGQALWALAKGVKHFGKWKNTLEKGLDYQVNKTWGFFLSDFYYFPFSWTMQAIEEAAPFLRKKSYQEFLFKTVLSMLDFQYTSDDTPFPDYAGGFGTPEWFMPLAHAAGFQGEGMTAAYGYAKQYKIKKYQHVLKKSLQSTLRFLLQEQITKASATFYADLKKTIGAFRGGPGDHRLQIDYTQHILAAMLNMLERGVFDY